MLKLLMLFDRFWPVAYVAVGVIAIVAWVCAPRFRLFKTDRVKLSVRGRA